MNHQQTGAYSFATSALMSKTKFEYVKDFEREECCLPNCWIVVRIDGRNFHKFTDAHGFGKPNDLAGLELMNCAATTVVEEFRDIVIAFGQSDEYSFVFRKDTELFKRRQVMFLSSVTSLFSAAYVYNWPCFFKNKPLLYPPTFDARVVLYPTDKNLRDYLAWRQADVHVNNLYNTCFWALVIKKKMPPKQAEEKLKGTLAAHKMELLAQEFRIDYNSELPIFRKGTTILRKLVPNNMGHLKPTVIPWVDDIINDRFWKENPEIIGLKSLAIYSGPMNNINGSKTMPNFNQTLNQPNCSENNVINPNGNYQQKKQNNHPEKQNKQKSSSVSNE